MAKTTKIVVSQRAKREISDIRENIENSFSSQRADKYIAGLFEKIERLESYPEFYPPCRHSKLNAAGFRCFVYKKQYRVIYEIYEGKVYILSVMWAGRNPKDFDELV